MTSPVTTENNAVDEAIRTLNLKLDVRKQDIWSPGVSFSAEIGEVETLIHEVYQLRSALTASEKDAARLREALEHARVWITRKQAELSSRVYRAEEMKDAEAWIGIGDGQFNGDWASINEIIDAAMEKANG